MKKQELSWKAGGQQGEGLESLGEIFAAALCSLGYDVYGYRQFSSRIKGGHTSYKLRIANHPVATIASSCNLLIAMDPDTLEVDAPELTAEGILVTDAAWLEGKKPKVRTVALSWNELSKADGKTLPKNILALGIRRFTGHRYCQTAAAAGKTIRPQRRRGHGDKPPGTGNRLRIY